MSANADISKASALFYARGYRVHDSTSESVITRITSQIQDHDESVVLCHDTKENTVNAMEYLIPWLLDNGYTLLPLTPDSETAHHAVLN